MSQLDDMFQTYASPVHQQYFGVTVAIRRGPRTTEDVPATWSRRPEDIDLEVMSTKITHRIYRIAVTDYVINGEQVEPKRADRIVESIAGVETQFEILPTERLPEFELDGDGKHWIIRTKKS